MAVDPYLEGKVRRHARALIARAVSHAHTCVVVPAGRRCIASPHPVPHHDLALAFLERPVLFFHASGRAAGSGNACTHFSTRDPARLARLGDHEALTIGKPRPDRLTVDGVARGAATNKTV